MTPLLIVLAVVVLGAVSANMATVRPGRGNGKWDGQ
jgi:hypothetical protein